MKRPMLYWVSLFILGELISLRASMVGIGCSVMGMLCFVIGIPFLLKKRKLFKNQYQKILWISGFLFFIAGIICMQSLSKDITRLQGCLGDGDSHVEYTGTVIETETTDSSQYYVVKLKRIKTNHGTFNIKRKIVIWTKQGVIPLPGYKIRGKGMAAAFRIASNPGGYDEKQYQFSNGICLKVVDGTIEEYGAPPCNIRLVLYHIRMYLENVYKRLLSSDKASLASAMVLGNKSGLDTDLKKMYQENGIAHLIAISGLHIAMIGGTIYKLLRKLLGGYMAPVGIGVLFIVLYGIMTGLSGATFRAVIMLVMVLLADLCGRKYDTLSAIGVALFFMLICNPYQITQAGFLLSFGAIIGIAVVYPVWDVLFPKRPKILDGFLVSFSVQMVLTPIMLYFFYEIAVYSVFINLFAVPLMSILLACLIVSALAGMCSYHLGSFFIIPARFIFDIYEFLCEINQKIPGNTYCMGRPEVWWIIIYYAILILFLVCAYHMEKIPYYKVAFVLLAGIGLLCFSVPLLTKDRLMICMLDVGQGDGIYIRTPHHSHILMDGGSSSEKNVGEYVLEKSIKYYGCNGLDYAIVSHTDSDHYSGIRELLEGNVTIHALVLPDIANPDEAYIELKNLALSKGCKVYYMSQGDELTVDGIHFTCLNPKPVSYEDKNTGSLVFLLNYIDFHMLFTGDMDASVENRLIKENVIRCNVDVLKVAHHGSDTASTEKFLERIKASVACISVGERNSYGHPSYEVIKRLRKLVPNIYLTKDDGAITINTDGKKIRITGYKWSSNG